MEIENFIQNHKNNRTMFRLLRNLNKRQTPHGRFCSTKPKIILTPLERAYNTIIIGSITTGAVVGSCVGFVFSVTDPNLSNSATFNLFFVLSCTVVVGMLGATTGLAVGLFWPITFPCILYDVVTLGSRFED